MMHFLGIHNRSGPLREMECEFNLIFDNYRQSYFNGGVSSVYLWNLESEEDGFGAAFLLHKGKRLKQTVANLEV